MDTSREEMQISTNQHENKNQEGGTFDVVRDLFISKHDRVTEASISSIIESDSKQAVQGTQEQDAQLNSLIESLVSEKTQPKQSTRGHSKQRVGCEHCGFTGWKVDSATGVRVLCSCQLQAQQESQLQPVKKQPELAIQNAKLLNAIIPLHRRSDEYSSAISKERVAGMARMLGCKVYGFTEFNKVLNQILSQITIDSLRNSYLLGAPNGFGKETFVYTCIKRLLAQGKKAVPYRSLFELAQLKASYEHDLRLRLRGLGGIQSESLKSDTNSNFIWSDYLKSDVLFTYLSSPDSRLLESSVLHGILNIRSKYNLPTVVITSNPIESFTSNERIKRLFWDEMLSYTNLESTTGVDRLLHRYCYMFYNKVEKGE